MELKTCLGNRYSNRKRAHSVREVLVGVDVCDDALVCCECRVRDSCPGEGHLSRVLHDG